MSTSQSITEPTHSPFRWYILATMIVVVATQAIALISPAPLIGEIITTTPELTPGEVTFLTMGSWNLVVAFSTIASGFVLEKVGFTRMYILGLVLMLAGWLLMPIIGDGGFGIGFARVIQALGAGPVMSAQVYIAATCFPLRERNMVTGMFGFAMSTGIAVGLALVPTFLRSTGGWQTSLSSLWFFAAIGIVMSIIAFFGLKRVGISEIAPPAETVDASGHHKSLFAAAMKAPVTWVVIGCVFLAAWFDQAFNDLTPGYIALDAPVGLGLGPEGGRLISIAMFGQMAGALIIGFIVEKIFKGSSRWALLVGSLVSGAGVFLLLSPLADQVGTLLAVLLLITFFKIWMNPIAFGFIAKNYDPAVAARLGGMAQGLAIFGGLAGVSVGSAALHATGFYTVSTAIMAIVPIVCALLALGLRSSKVPHSPQLDAERLAAQDHVAGGAS